MPKKALAAASQETEGGKLIDAKDQLIKKLRDRLNKVTNKPQAPKVTPEVEAAKDKLEDKIQKGLADKDLREKFLKELDKKASVEDINALQAQVEKEIKVQGVKDGAKSYLTNGIADHDLSKEQKAKYEKALSKVTSADEDYEQIVQDITQVAIAESLVARAEKGKHVKPAEEALTKAAKKTKGGQLIEGKDELIMNLQTRLAKVISEQDQTDQTPPSVEKQPEKEQEQAPTESEELKGKKESLRNFVDGIKSLSNEQKKFYLERLDSSKSVTQIEELFELFDAETLLARTKSGELPKEQVLPGIEEKLNKVFDKELQSKKAELQAELDKLTGEEDVPAPEVEEEQAPKATFEEKRTELSAANQKWNAIQEKLKVNSEGKKVATPEEREQLLVLSKEIKKLIEEWRKTAEGNEMNEQSVEGFIATAKDKFDQIPPLK